MTYVLSDIHGYADAFDGILEKIAFSDNDRLFIIGDVIDRGEKGIELLKRIMHMPGVTMLLGNHEYMMLEAITSGCSPDRMEIWFHNGGEPTFRAFSSLPREEMREILLYLAYRPIEIDLTVNGRDFRLVHAAPSERMIRPEIENRGNARSEEPAATANASAAASAPDGKGSSANAGREGSKGTGNTPASAPTPDGKGGSEGAFIERIVGVPEGVTENERTHFCVWTRLNPNDVWLSERTVIFGHTPTWYYGSAQPLSIMKFNGKIDVDCGMASGPSYGRLACLRLEDGAVFYAP